LPDLGLGTSRSPQSRGTAPFFLPICRIKSLLFPLKRRASPPFSISRKCAPTLLPCAWVLKSETAVILLSLRDFFSLPFTYAGMTKATACWSPSLFFPSEKRTFKCLSSRRKGCDPLSSFLSPCALRDLRRWTPFFCERDSTISEISFFFFCIATSEGGLHLPIR